MSDPTPLGHALAEGDPAKVAALTAGGADGDPNMATFILDVDRLVWRHA